MVQFGEGTVLNLKLLRYSSGKDSSGGLLFINGRFFCYTCEDGKRDVKISGETRIPEGKYEINLRDAGGMHNKYLLRYQFHRGMLHLQYVPGFEWIYIHTGNNDDHTEGCILVGYQAHKVNGEHQVFASRQAYTDLYQLILIALDRGEDIEIEITEE